MFTLDARKRRQCKNFEFYKNSREGKALMFDWIRRRKRSLDVGSNQNDDMSISFWHFVIKEDVFDIFDRKDNGIYKRREKSRKKRRTNSVEDLMRVLRNLPPIEPDINEIYVNLGDTVTIPCRERADNGTVHVWTTDRDDMLGYRNVDINDSSVIIKKVEIRNLGKYVCNDESKVLKTTILSTIEAPSFQVVFMLLYKSTARCNYDVLKAMKRLGSMMSSEVCGDGTHCSVRIDEPVCLKEKLGEQPLLVQAAGVLTAPHAPRPAPARTRRCVGAGLALLGAGVADVLLDAAASISDEDSNHTLTPTTQGHRKWSITHTLRRKASRECGGTRASRGLSPRAVAVRAACPAGYRLDLRQVLCVSCPSDTFAPAQSVRCRACPSGARARPGAARCRPAPGDKWIQRNITVARSVLAGVCFALVTYLLCLCCRHRKGNFDEERKTEHHHRHRRNLSTLQVHRAPSRFLRRHSPSSSRNTDSHDEKFAVWKERNIPPPLPPIDFDLYEKS